MIESKCLESVANVNAITQHAYEDHEDRQEELVAAACRLVGSDTGVRSVRVLHPAGQPMTNCFAIRNGRTINMFVSVSMAKVPSPCGRVRI